ncbi:hypothetical protein [Agriterribacter sp.]|uniref:hypothetical protein n=1 Tax=Agriterribacter sp. TaxID=2821509 RepID=UPI002CF3D8B5|nr:hypothetical protein [Agriterribacter sp.]HRO47207.1 hypothetical protein [Agriterribacter sp.]HRQ18435.1 hypothetical protein [Agriterribacter sp.]
MFQKNKILIFAITAVLFGFTACKKDKADTEDETEPPVEKTYGFLVTTGTPAATYVVQTGSVTEGTLTTVNNGIATTLSVFTSRDGYYYAIDYSSPSLVKFTSDNKTTNIIAETPFTQIQMAGWSGFFTWKDSKTLVMLNLNNNRFEYAELNVESMSITRSGDINIPAPAVAEDYYWGCNAVFVGSKLYIAYLKQIKANDELPEKAYVASMDYPNVTDVTISSDDRFNYPSPYGLFTQSNLVYNGSAYFITSPTFWAIGNIGAPNGIFRVLDGGTQIDDSYFYELTDPDKEETIGLYDLGNGKAIVKVLDKTRLAAYADYSAVNTASYYAVDFINKSKTRIDIPVSRSGAYQWNVLIDDGKAYIATNAGDGYYVYEYDPATSTVKKGLKLEGVDNVGRIYRIK